jgi:tRNA threonylcarbamoyladenosine modification (KEOPS) complex Cgi121 subunit
MKVTIQLVDAEKIATPLHLLFATHHALRAFHQGTERAKTVAMEILRYTAAQRQITRAIEILGVTHLTIHIGGVLLNRSQETLRKVYTSLLSAINAEDAQQVLEISNTSKAEAIQAAFNISAAELDAVQISRNQIDHFNAIAKLVYERCALLAIEK